MRIDGDVADAINKSKNDFYDKYEYLKHIYHGRLTKDAEITE